MGVKHLFLCYTSHVKNKIKNIKAKNKPLKMQSQFAEGIIRISHKGTGKVIIKETDETIEISHSFLRTALNGDTVRILFHPKKGKETQTGEVTKIIRRSKEDFREF